MHSRVAKLTLALELVALAVALVAFAGASLRFDPPATAGAASPVTLVTAIPEPPPPALTSAQLALKKRIEGELAAAQPTHRITLRNNRTIEAQIIETTPAALKIREGFGYSGTIVSTLKRDQIVRIESLTVPPPALNDADVRFAETFPDFHFVKLPPFTIVTDAPYAEVERTLNVLDDLREQFLRHFADLIRCGNHPVRIEVVFFNSEAPFRDYARRSAPDFAHSAGFYSARENRLVLLNQLGTTDYSRARQQLDRTRQRLDSFVNADPVALHEASIRLAALRTSVTTEAKAITGQLIRHEGAHQLLHAYGIESARATAPTWLSEGLAQYCETSPLGSRHAARVAYVKQATRAGKLLPLRTLLNHTDPAGFFALGSDQTETAYAQSWALTYYLRTRHPGPFTDFINRYRNARTVDHSEPAALLISCLHTDLAQLETDFLDFVSRL
jgi:hypothetical protein